MGNFVSGFLSNDSLFGRIMTRFYIIFAANIMFVIFSIPLVTAGAAYTAMYHVILKAFREDLDVRPFHEFWQGFKNNFKQSTIAWLLICVFAFLLWMDFRIIKAADGSLDMLKIFTYAILVAAAFGIIYIFPVIAAFRNSLGKLFSLSYYFAIKNPIRTIAMIFIHVFFAFWIYTDQERWGIFAFCFFFFGFAAIVYVCAAMLLKDFSRLLDMGKEEKEEVEEKEIKEEIQE